MATSYRMRMYRRQMWCNRYRIAGIVYGTLAATLITWAVIAWT